MYRSCSTANEMPPITAPTYNYTKLRLNWHTGIHLGAHPNYGGVAFFSDAPGTGSTAGGSVIARVGDGGYMMV